MIIAETLSGIQVHKDNSKYPKVEDCTITIKAEQEDVPVRGNYISSGDDDYDKDVEDKILAELESNVWVWCCVDVQASWNGIFGEVAYLGCCSYDSEKAFKEDDSYEDLKAIAYKFLCKEIDRLRKVLAPLETFEETKAKMDEFLNSMY